MTAFSKRYSRNPALEDRYADPMELRASRMSGRSSRYNPVAAQQDFDDFDAVSQRPANDDGRFRASLQVSPEFIGSRHFWAAMVATVGFCVLFAVLMGFRSASAIAALFHNPSQYSPFFLSMIVIAGIQWLLAMSAHRHAIQREMWRRMMAATYRMHEPNQLAEQTSRKIDTSFDRLFENIEARMATLDQKTTLLAEQISEVMDHSATSADVSLSQMRTISETAEAQREALNRASVVISAEVMPIISKLESAVQSLEAVSQTAETTLSGVGDQLQSGTRDLETYLEDFNRANLTVVPEIEKRILKLETMLGRLPEQFETTISRLNPMADTITDAAMLTTTNIEVVEQLSKEISVSLQKSQALFTGFTESNKELFQLVIDSHIESFREQLSTVITEETARLSGLSRELGYLAETAETVVNQLEQPVSQVTSAADRAITGMHETFSGLERRVTDSVKRSTTEMTDAAARVVNQVSRDIDTVAIALQTRLAASSTDLVQRVNTDASRFESIILETADKTSSRLATAIMDLPASVADRMAAEMEKIDSSLQGSVVGLSEQMLSVIEQLPVRLTSLTQDTLQALETGLESSFEGVAQRSDRLNDLFKRNATETVESVLQSYVDFIFLALERLRTEMHTVNSDFTQKLETVMKPMVAPEAVRDVFTSREQTVLSAPAEAVPAATAAAEVHAATAAAEPAAASVEAEEASAEDDDDDLELDEPIFEEDEDGLVLDADGLVPDDAATAPAGRELAAV